MARSCVVAALLVLGVVTPFANADSIVTIVSQLKATHDGSLELFGSIAESMKEAGATKDAAAVQQWSDDWLSVLGVSKGLAGLTKDYVLNYLGRSSYHDTNGPLIGAIKKLSRALPKKGESMDDARAKTLISKLSDVCDEGMDIFAKDGSLHTMLKELRGLLKESSQPHFVKGFKSNTQIRKTLDYLSGPQVDDRDYDNVGDDEL